MADHNNRIDYIEFSATDIPATKAFYAAVFGWTFTDYGTDYTSFNDGQMRGGFARVQSNATGGPLVILYSSALEKTQAAVTENGGRISKPIFAFPGGRRFQFLDPNGNELGVWSDT
jgi:predicted enzyme related to lactoylglutathione lyase